ncbi:hypothetical protein NMY22_g12696 [Coprinellus aureogranulatus]|nr:hypothetical protein NMY22_g12696 [Coprinellus aureogranulatus]
MSRRHPLSPARHPRPRVGIDACPIACFTHHNLPMLGRRPLPWIIPLPTRPDVNLSTLFGRPAYDPIQGRLVLVDHDETPILLSIQTYLYVKTVVELIPVVPLAPTARSSHSSRRRELGSPIAKIVPLALGVGLSKSTSSTPPVTSRASSPRLPFPSRSRSPPSTTPLTPSILTTSAPCLPARSPTLRPRPPRAPVPGSGPLTIAPTRSCMTSDTVPSRVCSTSTPLADARPLPRRYDLPLQWSLRPEVYWGTKEAVAKQLDVDIVVNFASSRSVYSSTLECLQFEQLKMMALITEDVPRRLLVRPTTTAWAIGTCAKMFTAGERSAMLTQ